MSLSAFLMDALTRFVEELGFIGIFLTMAAESCFIPIPSEIVMPFAGYVAWLNDSKGFFVGAVIASTFGNLAGAIVLYFIASRLGRPFVEKYGKYFLLSRRELELAEKWFLRYGAYSIFFGRMTPAVRTVISFPAGLFEFDLRKFITLTFIGSIPWNLFLTYLGYVMGPYWSLILEYSVYVDGLVVAAVILLIIVLALRFRERET